MDEGITRHDKKVWVRGYSFCEPRPFCKVWSLLVSGLTSKWDISPEGPVVEPEFIPPKPAACLKTQSRLPANSWIGRKIGYHHHPSFSPLPSGNLLHSY